MNFSKFKSVEIIPEGYLNPNMRFSGVWPNNGNHIGSYINSTTYYVLIFYYV